ncbi:hypothetical protein EFA69_15025 [Rufibacter immobilis]|uniref:Uncharacterized protein n=1 Tax=Rufibacter immobilis TaxID=1348778 RepID=A0A3M9MPI6_9BACT|nr:hypothetical protein [Rufibacter immobilis]RNI27442.1 hypothetical protein EFA69_15025 [Rufibacter immobilis]
MEAKGYTLKGAINERAYTHVSISVPKKPGGQTSKLLFGHLKGNSTITLSNNLEFKAGSSSEGIVVDGFFLGTFEFDSLTGHPGIRY